MPKKNTYFEQVPLEVVKKIVEKYATREEENSALKVEDIQPSQLPYESGKGAQSNGSAV
jgi:hypothetical protein